jgi:hypothetical protein
LSSFLFARIISTKSDARFDSFFIHEGEAWFTAPTYYPLKLSFMWIMQIMWVFTVLLPVTIVLWKAPAAANMDMLWYDWIFFALALSGTSKPRRIFAEQCLFRLDCGHEFICLLCLFCPSPHPTRTQPLSSRRSPISKRPHPKPTRPPRTCGLRLDCGATAGSPIISERWPGMSFFLPAAVVAFFVYCSVQWLIFSSLCDVTLNRLQMDVHLLLLRANAGQR